MEIVVDDKPEPLVPHPLALNIHPEVLHRPQLDIPTRRDSDSQHSPVHIQNSPGREKTPLLIETGDVERDLEEKADDYQMENADGRASPDPCHEETMDEVKREEVHSRAPSEPDINIGELLFRNSFLYKIRIQ